MPTVRVNEDIYQNLLDLSAILEKSRKHPVSLGDVIIYIFKNRLQTVEEIPRET